jgi:hypothetical protein
MKYYEDNFAHDNLPNQDLQPDYTFLDLPQFQHPEMLNCVHRLLDYQIEIGKILIGQYKITHNENQNGIFINLSNVSYEILEKLQKYIDYVNLQESQLNQTEC